MQYTNRTQQFPVLIVRVSVCLVQVDFITHRGLCIHCHNEEAEQLHPIPPTSLCSIAKPWRSLICSLFLEHFLF